jgi:hypothetical protein
MRRKGLLSHPGWALPVALLLLSAGCAETVRVSRMKPAEVNLAGYRKVAVANVTGKNGRSFAAYL